MSEGRLTYRQAAVLLVLRELGTPLAHKELKEEWGLDLDTKNRAGLVDAKLIESETRARRAFWYTITPAGEERAIEEVRAGVPVTSRSGKTLALLYLRSLLAPGAAVPVAEEPVRAPVTTVSPVSPEEVEDRIREAYAKITPGAGRWAAMTKLRALLTDIDRDLQDDVLRAMMLAGRVDIEPVAILGDLKPEDHAAAIVIGSTPNHQFRVGA
ncbi:MarR family winged helix-turn-helix transcriptional regulator [Streptosporangium sp. NPDC023825]|uniref:MarR family winged helix-turn-helix transcriptional regulator n=1 Tax=Streptosporangium sp. NPDC023825 TaxID=3154909 RepID=UPI0034338BA6